MQEDFFAPAEKILNDLYQLFTKDSKLKSFEIVTVSQNENKSPIHYQEHCLGLESWCIPHIYCYAYRNLMDTRQLKKKVRDIERHDSLLIGALILNPDITTFWNMRKDLVKCGKLDPYFELHFSRVVLTFKPKCADVYAFRKWILKYISKDTTMDLNQSESEIEVCEAAADRYSNNYHAWTHRIWCLSQSLPGLFQKEWVSSVEWSERHVSDYSGFNYRQKFLTFLLVYIQSSSYDPEVIKLIIFNVDAVVDEFFHNLRNLELTMQNLPLPLKVFIYELALISELICNFIGHETLWCHRRFIFHGIKRVLFGSNQINKAWGYFETSNHSTPDGMPVEKTQKIGIGTLGDQFSLLLSLYEDIFLKKCLNEQEPRQMSYAEKHKKWLSHFSKFQLPHNNDDVQSITFEIPCLPF